MNRDSFNRQSVNLVNAHLVARERGLTVREERTASSEPWASLVALTADLARVRADDGLCAGVERRGKYILCRLEGGDVVEARFGMVAMGLTIGAGILLSFAIPLAATSWNGSTKSSPWENIEHDGQTVKITTPGGVYTFDFLIIGTGFVTDLSLRPELAELYSKIALWSDRYQPEEDERHDDRDRNRPNAT